MVSWRKHYASLPDTQYMYALLKLIEIGKKVFDYTPKFVIMEGTYATIKGHWHLVATDLNPEADDFNQILKTPWLEVINTSDI